MFYTKGNIYKNTKKKRRNISHKNKTLRKNKTLKGGGTNCNNETIVGIFEDAVASYQNIFGSNSMLTMVNDNDDGFFVSNGKLKHNDVHIHLFNARGTGWRAGFPSGKPNQIAAVNSDHDISSMINSWKTLVTQALKTKIPEDQRIHWIILFDELKKRIYHNPLITSIRSIGSNTMQPIFRSKRGTNIVSNNVIPAGMVFLTLTIDEKIQALQNILTAIFSEGDDIEPEHTCFLLLQDLESINKQINNRHMDDTRVSRAASVDKKKIDSIQASKLYELLDLKLNRIYLNLSLWSQREKFNKIEKEIIPLCLKLKNDPFFKTPSPV